MNPTPPPILRLPADLLSDILSLALTSVPPKHFYELFPHKFEPTDSPFHAIRSTCRAFRWTVDELLFWRNDTFSFAHEFERDVSFGYVSAINRYFHVLLLDPHLRQSLARKSGWIAHYPSFFQKLVRNIPQFGQRVRYLQIRNMDEDLRYSSESWDDVPVAIGHHFPILTVLELASEGHVHLDVLPSSLQRLVFDAPLSQKCDCRNNLPNLEQLHYVRFAVARDLTRILPFNSSNSLRELKFAFAAHNGKPEFALLDQFKNLTTLRTTGSGDTNAEFYRFLSQSTLRLKAFETEAPIPDCDQALLDLLRSPVLHNVRCLRLDLWDLCNDDMSGEHIYEEFLRAIVKLPVLESLKFIEFRLHMDWIQHFRNSQHLKSVRWEYRKDSRLLQPTDLGDLEDALRNILARSGNEMPTVTIKPWEYDRRYGDHRDPASEIYRSVECDSDDGI
jgi:hypothetical protein